MLRPAIGSSTEDLLFPSCPYFPRPCQQGAHLLAECAQAAAIMAARSCSDVPLGTSLPFVVMRRLVMLVLHVLYEEGCQSEAFTTEVSVGDNE